MHPPAVLIGPVSIKIEQYLAAMFHKTIKLSPSHMLFDYKVLDLIPNSAKSSQKVSFCLKECLQCNVVNEMNKIFSLKFSKYFKKYFCSYKKRDFFVTIGFIRTSGQLHSAVLQAIQQQLFSYKHLQLLCSSQKLHLNYSKPKALSEHLLKFFYYNIKDKQYIAPNILC